MGNKLKLQVCFHMLLCSVLMYSFIYSFFFDKYIYFFCSVLIYMMHIPYQLYKYSFVNEEEVVKAVFTVKSQAFIQVTGSFLAIK